MLGRRTTSSAKVLVTALYVGLALGSACSGASERDDKRSGSRSSTGGAVDPDGGHAGEEGPSSGSSGKAGGSGGRGGTAGSASRGGTESGAAGAGGRAGAGGSSAGASGLGGSAGLGGSKAGSGGFNGGAAGAGGPTGGSGGRRDLPIPPDWTCSPEAWNDGRCHCGCGSIDADCHEWTLEECEVCDDPLSCSPTACPGNIDPDLQPRCKIPWQWQCPQRAYRDGHTCHCGCGFPDPDCSDGSIGSCEVCNQGCSGAPCPGSIDPDDTTACTRPPEWRCDPYGYGDGVCTCGCGIRDIDCATGSAADCEVCWDGCAEDDCPGTIDPDDNAVCSGPPPHWTCARDAYQDGTRCDCGCGARDPDCETEEIESCDRCNLAGSCSDEACPGKINIGHTQSCVDPPVPPEWTCSQWAYADAEGLCDCGCGARDLNCPSLDAEDCRRCPVDSCSEPNCSDIAPSDNAHCR